MSSTNTRFVHLNRHDSLPEAPKIRKPAPLLDRGKQSSPMLCQSGHHCPDLFSIGDNTPGLLIYNNSHNLLQSNDSTPDLPSGHSTPDLPCGPSSPEPQCRNANSTMFPSSWQSSSVSNKPRHPSSEICSPRYPSSEICPPRDDAHTKECQHSSVLRGMSPPL